MFNLHRSLKEWCFFTFVVTSANSSYGSQYDLSTGKTYELNITNDGPVPLDIPITFQVLLINSVRNETFTYSFVDNVDPPHKLEIRGNNHVSATFYYPEETYKPGYYTMVITCYAIYFDAIPWQIATGNVSFHITQYISGSLDFSGVTRKYDKLYAAAGNYVNMTMSLGLPQHIINSSELSYSWNINQNKFITSNSFNSYMFEEPGTYSIHVTAVARIPLNDGNKYKWGYFNEELNIKASLTSINLTGNTYLKHGQLFNVEVFCSGSGPFEYCWKVLAPSANTTNFTCLSPVVTTHCSFPIIYYFNPSGDYKVLIAIDNFVSYMQRKIDVHIYDVSLSPQLSTVIIPLFCSVLVIFIIAGGVMLHVRRNQKFDIETADFDFLQSDTCIVETFWERLYHSILSVFGIQKPKAILYLTIEERATPSAFYDSTNP